MALTYNQVIKRIETIALAHKQVRTFKRGLVTDFLVDKTIPYAAIFLQDGGAAIDPGQNSAAFSFRLFFLDLVHVSEDTKANELDVLSDMFSVALDIIAQLNYPAYNDWKVSVTNNMQSLVENDGDMNAGWYLDMQVRTPWDQNICEVPTDIILPGVGIIYFGVQDSNADPVDFTHVISQDPELSVTVDYGPQPLPKFYWVAVPATASNKTDWSDLNATGNNGQIGGVRDLFEKRGLDILGVTYDLYMTRYLTGFNGSTSIVKYTI